MGHQSLTVDLLVARDEAAEAYQRARPEIGHLQSVARNGVERRLLNASLLAYDLESFVRGYAMRMEQGALPSPSWRSNFKGTWRFYEQDNFKELFELSKTQWPMIAKYMESVIYLEKLFGSVIGSTERNGSE